MKIKIKVPKPKRYWHSRDEHDMEGILSEEKDLHPLRMVGEAKTGTPEEYKNLWLDYFELPF